MIPLYITSGIVKKGKNRGKSLGFPTANIALEQDIPEGIYISYTEIAKKPYQSVTFIGKATTFDEDEYQAETYIFDFSKDLYDTPITVILLKKLRDNQKFATVEKLVEQMKKDITEAQTFFDQNLV